MKICLAYHSAFYKDTATPFPMGIPIAWEQWSLIRSTGLADAAEHIIVGVNGAGESEAAVKACVPEKAHIVYHGLESKNENSTILELFKWAKENPGWACLYFHIKGVSHLPGTEYGERVAGPWRRAMMNDLVGNWRQCVADLESHDIACMLWLWDMGWDKSQHIPAGNFLWITSDFINKLPPLTERARIKEDGIQAASSRYEAEVAWGNGPRPRVKMYRNALPF